MLKKKKTMPSAKPGHGSKRPTDAQPQNEILRSRGFGGNPQQAAPEAEWLSRGIACQCLFQHVGFYPTTEKRVCEVYVYRYDTGRYA